MNKNLKKTQILFKVTMY